jgi:hypothetical protein
MESGRVVRTKGQRLARRQRSNRVRLGRCHNGGLMTCLTTNWDIDTAAGYAMVRDEQQHPQFIVQTAINKQGILRGNYIDELTENTLPIRGGVDNAMKRTAWRRGWG